MDATQLICWICDTVFIKNQLIASFCFPYEAGKTDLKKKEWNLLLEPLHCLFAILVGHWPSQKPIITSLSNEIMFFPQLCSDFYFLLW